MGGTTQELSYGSQSGIYSDGLHPTKYYSDGHPKYGLPTKTT